MLMEQTYWHVDLLLMEKDLSHRYNLENNNSTQNTCQVFLTM